jgi:hypothetical protein
MAGGAAGGAARGDGADDGADDGAGGDDAPLTGRELLVIQLRARRYADAQIDVFLGATRGAAARVLAGAAFRLGVHGAAAAIQEAAARGLILGGAGPAPMPKPMPAPMPKPEATHEPTQAPARQPRQPRQPRPYTRYAARWDETRQTHRIFDTVRGTWAAGQPGIADEGAAATLAETLNQRETVRQQRRWLRRDDGRRDRK